MVKFCEGGTNNNQTEDCKLEPQRQWGHYFHVFPKYIVNQLFVIFLRCILGLGWSVLMRKLYPCVCIHLFYLFFFCFVSLVWSYCMTTYKEYEENTVN